MGGRRTAPASDAGESDSDGFLLGRRIKSMGAASWRALRRRDSVASLDSDQSFFCSLSSNIARNGWSDGLTPRFISNGPDGVPPSLGSRTCSSDEVMLTQHPPLLHDVAYADEDHGVVEPVAKDRLRHVLASAPTAAASKRLWSEAYFLTIKRPDGSPLQNLAWQASPMEWRLGCAEAVLTLWEAQGEPGACRAFARRACLEQRLTLRRAFYCYDPTVGALERLSANGGDTFLAAGDDPGRCSWAKVVRTLGCDMPSHGWRPGQPLRAKRFYTCESPFSARRINTSCPGIKLADVTRRRYEEDALLVDVLLSTLPRVGTTDEPTDRVGVPCYPQDL